ncbi:MFRN [Mytilus edulis]|uniref:SLC25A28_37 n=1 Tax=Mytilus edulis TaxID=6550 RepID=A0A8S3TKG0_MYTED|nr:MFRN [Mytilus edulis]
MDDQDLYESLPPTSTSVDHMVAGAAAGILEHSVMYPVDCVKTRMQCLIPDPKADYRSIADAFYKIVKYEGVRNTVRGVSAVIGGAGPAHAMYFACYEKMKKIISGGHQGNHFAHGTAGLVSTLLHDMVMNPAEVVKQRMQMFDSPYKSCSNCIKVIYKEEGVMAFYRSFTTQLTMNIPFQCIHFMTYEIMQDIMNKNRGYDPSSHMISGAIAGAAAAVATMPLDVCKTLLNTQECCSRSQVSYVNGMTSAFRLVYEYQGLRGYFKGVQARVIFQMPATGISWSVYELFKYLLTQRQNMEDKYPRVNGLTVKAVESSEV